MWSCWPARDWTSQISYEAVASVVRVLNVFEALMCFFTFYTKYNEPLASVICDSDDDGYDIVECGAADQPVTVPLRSATRHRYDMAQCGAMPIQTTINTILLSVVLRNIYCCLPAFGPVSHPV